MSAETFPDRSRRVRVLGGQIAVDVALFATFAAAVSVLLPARIAELDPHGKVGYLAAILSISFVVSAVALPIVGALSDRTRTRFGRRLPWAAAGALVGGLAIGLVGGAPSVILIGILWVIAQSALHGVQVAVDAYLVDVFPEDRRGRAAGIAGIAVVVGAGVGAVFSGSLAGSPSVVSWTLAALVAVSVIAFASLVHDRATPVLRRPRRPPGARARAVVAAVSAHPDFVKLLLWRVAFSIAYGAVFGYLLYLITDLVGVPTGDAGRLIGLATVLGGAAALVGVLLGGWLSDRLRRRRLFLLIGSAALLLGDLLLLASPSVPSVLATAAVFGVGLGLSISCGRALGSQVLPNQVEGAATGLGVITVATSIGQAVAPAVGALAIGWGGYPALLVTSLVFATAAVVPVVLIRSVR
ncbi:MFS transporter [Pseudolysinimonas kribbensis]|uniref:MFS transporter n=1 Tax=Pseudolysinimonas kribbensis TaxID=433641 RepID=UPI0031E4743C